MNFKELLQRYKEGTATKEEKVIVETELEKYESIEGYFSEQLHDDLFMKDQAADDTALEEVEETLSIKRLVNRKLAKVIMLSVLIVILLYVGIFYGLSNVVDSLYYDPTSVTTYEDQEHTVSDFSFDMKAYVSLNMPGYALSSFTTEESQGFGVYETSYLLRNLYTNDLQRHFVDIHRGARRNFDDGIFSHANRFEIWDGFRNIHSPVTGGEEGMSEEHQQGEIERKNDITLDYLGEVNPLSYVSITIVFDEDLTMEEFYEMSREFQMLNFNWVGVRTIEPGTSWSENQPNHLIGFNPNVNDEPAGNMRPNPEEYPLFNLVDLYQYAPTVSSESFFPEAFETHFESRLTYLRDREEFVELFDYNPYKTDFYTHSLDYIEENGINTYGVLVYGTAEDFQEQIDNLPFESLYINDVASAKPNIYFD
ncbi:anti sigma factor C-terminal domain-containing protein [Alkalibacterium sp.]|nr:MAG: hypothetical protein EA249_03905 [Alkalibacterium sp.]